MIAESTGSMRTLVAVLRAYKAALNKSPKTYFLICHAQGIARREGCEAISSFLKLAEHDLTLCYQLEGIAGAVYFSGARRWIERAASELLSDAVGREQELTTSHPPNNWDYTKRIHRKGHGWKANHLHQTVRRRIRDERST